MFPLMVPVAKYLPVSETARLDNVPFKVLVFSCLYVFPHHLVTILGDLVPKTGLLIVNKRTLFVSFSTQPYLK